MLDAATDAAKFPFLAKTLVTYTILNPGGKEEKRKEDIVFKLDRASATMPWYVLLNYLVPNYLKVNVGPRDVSWQRVYEIKILKLINRKDPADITDIPLRVMTLDQLAAYSAKWDLAVPVGEFFSVEKAREMVALRQEDEKGYRHHYAEYVAGKQRNYPELDAIRGSRVAETAGADEFDALDKKGQETPLAKAKEELKKPREVTGAPSLESKDPFAGF